MAPREDRVVKILLVEIANRNLGDTIIADNTRALLQKVLPRRRGTIYHLLDYSVYSNDPTQVQYADAVVFVGGAFFKFRQEKFYQTVYTLLHMAQRCGVPVYFNGIGVEGYDEGDPRCRMLKKALSLPCVKGIAVRDDECTVIDKYLEGHSIPVWKVLDPAVWTPETYAPYLTEVVKRPVIGLGVTRELLFADHGQPEVDGPFQLEFWKGIIIALESRELDWEIFTNGASGDEHFAQAVLTYVGHGRKAPTPVEGHHVVTTIAGYSGIIAGRMHSNIVAYSLGVPSIGLVWNDKLRLWGKRIGCPERFVSAEDMQHPVSVVDALVMAQNVGCSPISTKQKRAILKGLRDFINTWATPHAPFEGRSFDSARLVAPAMGAYGMKYKFRNNCQAMEQALDSGFQCLEVDVRLTSDDVPVCVYAWNEKTYTMLGLNPEEYGERGIPLETFQSCLCYGHYATNTFEELVAAIAASHRDFTLIVDARCDEGDRLELLYSRMLEILQTYRLSPNRLYWRLFTPQDVALASRLSLPYGRMYHLAPYESVGGERNCTVEDVVAFCQKEGIGWITMAPSVYTPDVGQCIRAGGLKCCVLNCTKTEDIQRLLDCGVDLIGSDCYTVEQLRLLFEVPEQRKENTMAYKITKIDPYLKPFEKDIALRMDNYVRKRTELVGEDGSLVDFANGHHYFGIHSTDDGWVYREWAPGADEMYFTGDFCDWDIHAYPMTRLDNGVFEVVLPGKAILQPGQRVQAIVIHGGEILRRIPSYATRVVQDPVSYLWCAEVDTTLTEAYPWSDADCKPARTPYIYECHIGMAQDAYKVGSYKEFTENILPRIKAEGYNTLQIMAIMEHPYYGSFGYQVSNFFAASSRYGTAWELKELIDTAHKKGMAVLLDVVHSHAVKNTAEGLNEFDGTPYQYFHEGGRGNHSAWDTKLFNYNKNEVLHFLLSNLRYWMEVFHFDGFRFDGVTSMLYHDHGLGSAFSSYDMYFSLNTDTEAVTYLQLANELIHTYNPHAVTVAEDMSGMPGMCLPIADGGIGFDYRLSMGVPDMWIKTIKECTDEQWDMFKIWYELTGRRPKEKNIGYCESHDQALVGDKTIMFRLCDANMYTGMCKNSGDPVIDRGVALHKMIRLLTASVAGEGYLNFMGNEFGHPEWIDFPREGNGWSYHYCRRQWSLADDKSLRYGQLGAFDKAMIALLKRYRLLSKKAENRWIHDGDKVLMYTKDKTVFAFNFHPENSFEGYFVPTGRPGTYRAVLSTDQAAYGGFDRVDMNYEYTAQPDADGRFGFYAYLPSRTATVFQRME